MLKEMREGTETTLPIRPVESKIWSKSSIFFAHLTLYEKGVQEVAYKTVHLQKCVTF